MHGPRPDGPAQGLVIWPGLSTARPDLVMPVLAQPNSTAVSGLLPRHTGPARSGTKFRDTKQIYFQPYVRHSTKYREKNRRIIWHGLKSRGVKTYFIRIESVSCERSRTSVGNGIED